MLFLFKDNLIYSRMSIRFRTFVFLLLLLLNKGQPPEDPNWERTPNGTKWSIGDIFNTLSSTTAVPVAAAQTLVFNKCGIDAAKLLGQQLVRFETFEILRDFANAFKNLVNVIRDRPNDEGLQEAMLKAKEIWDDAWGVTLMETANIGAKKIKTIWHKVGRWADAGVTFLHLGNIVYDLTEVEGWQKVAVLIIDGTAVLLNGAEVMQSGKIESYLNPLNRIIFVIAKNKG